MINIETSQQEVTEHKNTYDDRCIVKNIVQSVSRGNINLQLGRFITEEDKAVMRNKVINYVIKANL